MLREEKEIEEIVALSKSKDVKAFVTTCRDLRFWAREMKVDLDAAA